jgi:hypothetical protein
MQANYILFLEETYQKLNREKPANDDLTKVDSSPEEGQFFITVGTKNAIKNLPSSSQETNGTRLAGDLVNPSKKSELMKEKNIELEEEKGDDFLDIEEII